MSGLASRREVPESGVIVIPELDLSSFLREPLLFDRLSRQKFPGWHATPTQ